jgi:hypothetical protein
VTTPVYVWICTKSTAPTAVPARYDNQVELNRKVMGAFVGLAGGYLTAGDLKLRPTADAIANHLLCDGSVLAKEQFPQLFEYLGDTFGGDGVATFGLPDYRGDILAMPDETPDQTVSDGGTVSTGGTVTPPSGNQTGGTTGGNVVSGGRPNNVDELNTRPV